MSIQNFLLARTDFYSVSHNMTASLERYVAGTRASPIEQHCMLSLCTCRQLCLQVTTTDVLDLYKN